MCATRDVAVPDSHRRRTQCHSPTIGTGALDRVAPRLMIVATGKDERVEQWKASLLDVRHQLPGPPSDCYPAGLPFVTVMRHGTMSVELFQPRDVDLQDPHDQDELYVVIAGRSGFLLGEQRTECAAGDVLFVPAGMPHRFVDIENGFEAWVIFWGPTGGESSDRPS